MDPLSLAASGIGIVSLGIQIADSIQKCLRFWKSVKGAPSDIGRIVEDLEALDEILNSVMAYHQGLQGSENSPNPIPLPRALQSCANRLMDVVRTISDLEQGLQTRKLWTSLRTAFREEAINKVRRDLESAKSSLILSNQLVLSQLQQAQYRKMVAQQKNIAVITQSVAQISIAVAKPPTNQSLRRQTVRESRFEQGHVRELPGDEDSESGVRVNEGKAVSKRKPTSNSNSSKMEGILRRGFSMYSQRALRDARVVPRHSPIFKYARLGNVEQLWDLFDKGLASPFDTDPDGQTPLHIAARCLQSFACKFLIGLGADSNAVTKYGFTSLALVSTVMLDLRTHSADVVDLTRHFVEHGDADPFIETRKGVLVYHSYEGTIDGLKILYNENPFQGSMAAKSSEDWGVLYEQISYAGYHDPFLLDRLRWWIMKGADVNGKTRSSAISNGIRVALGTTPIHIACLGTCNCFESHQFLLLIKPGLVELLLEAGANIHAMDGCGYTPLRLIDHNFRPEELFRWFQILWKLGVNLPDYLDFECCLYQGMLDRFNPKTVWNSAIRYGLGRRVDLEKQDSPLAHISELFEEQLEEYQGIPNRYWLEEEESSAEVDDADSSETNISEVHLSEADIREADIREADVHEADIHEAGIHEADIPEANISEATFLNETVETVVETPTEIPASRNGQTLPTPDHQHLPPTETQVSIQPHVSTSITPQLKRKKAAVDLKCAETGRNVEKTTGTRL